MRSNSAALLALLLLAACAGHAPRPMTAQAASPARVKIGQPYQVLGQWYYPKDERDYDATGIASWYGPGFHGLSTANGEAYTMDGLSAAHKTLPMPSYVEVSNLDNGRKLVVRINDRGPFVAGRIIDLSRRAAQLLGVDRPGTAHVRVRRIFPDAATMASLAPSVTTPQSAVPTQAAVSSQVVAASVPLAVPVADAAPVAVTAVELPPALPSAPAIYIQVAALSDQGKAAWLAAFLKDYGATRTERTPAGLWRVQVGPFGDAVAAQSKLSALQAAGYADAHLVRSAPPS